MKKLYTLLVVSSLVTFSTWANAAQAGTIELNNVSPSVDEDITPPDDDRGETENFHTFWLKGQIDQTYTATFSVSEEPAFTFVSGGAMTLDDNITYDADSGEFTVTYTAKPLQQIDAQGSASLEENQTLTIIAVSFPVGEGEQGPGANSVGSWVSSHFQEWTLVTPSEDNNAMGATLRGDAGDVGTFSMFVPTRALETMAENQMGESANAAVNNFSVYEDEAKSSAQIQAVDGGAFVSFETTIPEESSEESEQPSGEPGQEGMGPQAVRSAFTGSPSLKVVVAPKPLVNLARVGTSGKVANGDFIRLKGKLRNGLAGKRVILQRTLDGTTYSKVAVTTTKLGGHYSFRVKVNKMAAYRVKFGSQFSGYVRVLLK